MDYNVGGRWQDFIKQELIRFIGSENQAIYSLKYSDFVTHRQDRQKDRYDLDPKNVDIGFLIISLKSFIFYLTLKYTL